MVNLVTFSPVDSLSTCSTLSILPTHLGHILAAIMNMTKFFHCELSAPISFLVILKNCSPCGLPSKVLASSPNPVLAMLETVWLVRQNIKN